MLEKAHPIIEKSLGMPGLSRTKVLDYVIVRGLSAMGMHHLVEHLWSGGPIAEKAE